MPIEAKRFPFLPWFSANTRQLKEGDHVSVFGLNLKSGEFLSWYLLVQSGSQAILNTQAVQLLGWISSDNQFLNNDEINSGSGLKNSPWRWHP